MTNTGSSSDSYSLLFPDDFSGIVMLLLYEAWQQLELPAVVTWETRITALFHKKMLQLYDRELIYFIQPEGPITDPLYGTELGRNDLLFYPIDNERQTKFFTVECKRLHTTHGTLITEYIKDGMMRFLINGPNQYSQGVSSGAMVGYVLDGDMPAAFDALCKKIENQKIELRLMEQNGLLHPSVLLPEYDHSADSRHLRDDKPFLLHHVLFPVNKNIKNQ